MPSIIVIADDHKFLPNVQLTLGTNKVFGFQTKWYNPYNTADCEQFGSKWSTASPVLIFAVEEKCERFICEVNRQHFCYVALIRLGTKQAFNHFCNGGFAALEPHTIQVLLDNRHKETAAFAAAA